jgi:hypothetical protein
MEAPLGHAINTVSEAKTLVSILITSIESKDISTLTSKEMRTLRQHYLFRLPKSPGTNPDDPWAEDSSDITLTHQRIYANLARLDNETSRRERAERESGS